MRILLIIGLFLMIHRAHAQDYTPYTGWEHVHSAYSDGEFGISEIKTRAKQLGLQFIFMSEHGDCFFTPQSLHHREGKLFYNFHQHSGVNSFSDYLEEVNILNEDHIFVIYPGREVTVAKNPAKSYCHMNAFSPVTTTESYTYQDTYGEGDVARVIDIIHYEKGICVYNHPKDCKNWWDSADQFDAIEMMNTVGLDIKALATGGTVNYTHDLSLLLAGVKKGRHQFVVGGQDFHSDGSWRASGMGLITTAIFANDLTQASLYSALQEGKTVALRNTKILKFNRVPSITTENIQNTFALSGTVEVTKGEFTKRLGKIWIQLYKNGMVVAKAQATQTKVNNATIEMAFTIQDPNPSEEGKETSYIAEIPQLMITSPFWARKGERLYSTRTLPITWVKSKEGMFSWETEPKGVTDKMERIVFCIDDGTVRNMSGKIVLCTRPRVAFFNKHAQVDARASHGPIFFPDESMSPSEDRSAWLKKTIDAAHEKFIWELTEHDFVEHHKYLYTYKSTMKEGDLFGQCADDPESFVFDQDDHVENCSIHATWKCALLGRTMDTCFLSKIEEPQRANQGTQPSSIFIKMQ
ncbi:MAG: hypothetical protein WC045_00255 [Patescibacteria group bacterium]